MFELTQPTEATLSSVTNRSELHGDDKVPAISLGFTVEAANTILDRLAESLGLIGMKLGQDLSITLLAPKVAGEPKAKDGGGELFKDEAKPAAKKARKGDADPSGQGGPWPFPKTEKASGDPVLDAAKAAHGVGESA